MKRPNAIRGIVGRCRKRKKNSYNGHDEPFSCAKSSMKEKRPHRRLSRVVNSIQNRKLRRACIQRWTFNTHSHAFWFAFIEWFYFEIEPTEKKSFASEYVFQCAFAFLQKTRIWPACKWKLRDFRTASASFYEFPNSSQNFNEPIYFPFSFSVNGRT